MASLIIVGTNSYVTYSEADTYLTTSLDSSDWTALTTEQKEKYLIEACQILECQTYIGWKYSETQALSFPRTFVNIENYTPENVKKAQAEQALWLTTNYEKLKDRLTMDSMNITDIGIGDITETRQKIKNMLGIKAFILIRQFLVNNEQKVYRT